MVFRLVELADGGVDAELAEHALHAEGARLIRHDGHHALADGAVSGEGRKQPHERHRRGHAALASALELTGEGFVAGRRELGGIRHALGNRPAQAFTLALEIDRLRRIFRRAVIGHGGQRFIRERQAEAIPKVLQIVQIELLHLMGGVFRFPGIPHAIALDRLGQDDSGLALVVRRGVVGRKHLERIVAAAVQAHDVVVREVFHQLAQLRTAAEEVFARVAAALGLVVLVFAIHGLVHALLQEAMGVLGDERVP